MLMTNVGTNNLNFIMIIVDNYFFQQLSGATFFWLISY